MSPRDLAFVGCRLLALFALLNSLQAIVFNTWFLLQLFRSQEQWSAQDKITEWGFYTVPMLALLVMVAILWWGADWIAERVTARTKGMPAQALGGWSPKGVLSVAVVALGLWVLIDQLPLLMSHVFLLATSSDSANAKAVDLRGPVAAILTIVLGIACIVGSQTIADLLGRMRRW